MHVRMETQPKPCPQAKHSDALSRLITLLQKADVTSLLLKAKNSIIPTDLVQTGSNDHFL